MFWIHKKLTFLNDVTAVQQRIIVGSSVSISSILMTPADNLKIIQTALFY